MCGEKSLSEYVRASKNKRLTERETRLLFKQFISAIKYIHGLNICHRDLKLTNILIDETEKVNGNSFSGDCKIRYS